MIARVAARELLREYRLWSGALTVIVASSAVCAASLAQLETASSLSPGASESLRSMAQGVIAFGMLAAIAITGAATNLAVASGRRGYALLQLAGFLPRQVILMTFAQLAMLAFVGTAVGLGIGRAVAQPFLDVVVEQTSVHPGVQVVYGWSTVVLSFLLMAGVVMVAGARSAVQAGRVPPIEALRAPEPPRIRTGPLRRLGVIVSAGLTIAVALGIANTTPLLTFRGVPVGVSLIIGLGMLMSIGLAATAALIGPVLYPTVLRAWSALVPARVAGSWFLARRSCAYRVTQSTAAITPLMIGIALPGSLYTVFLTAGSALGGGSAAQINSGSVFTTLGPALLLAALGSAVIVFMTGRTRSRDAALVAVSGGTFATGVLSAVFEALIYVVTSLVIASGILALVGVVVAMAFRRMAPDAIPVFGMPTALLVAAVGAVIVMVATVLPAIVPTSRSIPRVLNAG